MGVACLFVGLVGFVEPAGASPALPLVPGLPGIPLPGLPDLPGLPSAAGPSSPSSSPAGGVEIPGLPGVGGGVLDSAFGGLAGAGAAAVFGGLAQWVAEGTSSLLGPVVEAIDHVTKPDLRAAWFDGQYRRMGLVAGYLVLPLLVAAAITAIVRQDLRGLLRAVGVQLPVAVIGMAAAVQIINLALAATDGLCAVVSGGTGADTRALFDNLHRGLDVASPGAGSFAVMIVSIVVAIGALLLALELIVRTAAVYVAVLFLPVAFAGLVWPSTARWARRLAETLTVLILSKFVVVAVVAMAVAALGAGIAGEGLSGLLTGASLLLLAAAAPFALLRMVPIVEAGMIGHLEGVGRKGLPAMPSSSDAIRPLLARAGARPPSGGPAQGPSGADIPTASANRSILPDGTQGSGGVTRPPGAPPGGGADLPVAAPVRGAGASVSGAPVSGAPVSGAPVSGAPVSGAGAVATGAAATAAGGRASRV
ncbi:MAG: hypothetical protein NVS3B12_18460 [Acidimicrobiales bacterium]